MSFRFQPQLVCALLVSVVLTGCGSLVSKPEDSGAEATGKMILRGLLFLPTFGVSERRITRYRESVPITDGSQTRLSPSTAVLVVVGSNSTANIAAITWLQKRGVSIVERTNLDRIFVEQELRLTHSSDEEGMLLRAGRLSGASEMVFIEVSQSSVSVRSVDLESGKIGWTGTRYRSNKIDVRSSHPGTRYGIRSRTFPRALTYELLFLMARERDRLVHEKERQGSLSASGQHAG